MTRSAPARAESTLVVLSGGSVGKLFKLRGQRASIGRAAGNDIPLDDDGISRRHAFIESEPGGFVLYDGERMGSGYVHRSTNGVFVNGTLIEKHRLRDGDKIEVGPVLLKYIVVNPDVSAGSTSSTKDPLTGVSNKLFFVRRLTTELAAQRTLQQPLSIAVVDIDHLKKINDDHGHELGDLVVRAVARAVEDVIRPADVVARYGGEEFVLMFPNTDAKQAFLAAERIRRAVADLHVTSEGKKVPITVSIGVVTSVVTGPTDAIVDYQSLMRAAEERMAQAKSGGRNRTEPARA